MAKIQRYPPEPGDEFSIGTILQVRPGPEKGQYVVLVLTAKQEFCTGRVDANSASHNEWCWGHYFALKDHAAACKDFAER